MSKKQQTIATYVFGGLSFAVLVGVLVLAPAEMPEGKHRIVGLMAAFAAGFLAYFMSGFIDVEVQFPWGKAGKMALKAAGGIALFVFVLWWWNSDQSPSKAVKEIKKVGDAVGRVGKKQDEANERLAVIEAQLREFNRPKRAQEVKESLPPDLIEKAKLLLERGDKEQRAVAAIALKNHDEAAKVIEELKKDVLADAFQVLTLEGDNLYSAEKYDEAIKPYSQAYSLKPEDRTARGNLALALQQARLGNRAAQLKQAIRLHEENVSHYEETGDTYELAQTQNNLALAWSYFPTGNKTENLKRAMACYKAAQTVWTKEAYPTEWAISQNNLASAWWDLPTEDKTENLKKAIAGNEAALTVYTREAYPAGWARTCYNLAVCHRAQSELLEVDRRALLAQARDLLKGCLEVWTADSGKREKVEEELAKVETLLKNLS